MKSVFLTVVLSSVLIPAMLFAQMNGNRFYVGAGGSWSITDSSDPDDSPGANLKLGYHAHRLLDIEFNFDWIDKFEDSEGIKAWSTPLGNLIEATSMTGMIGLKGYFPLPSDIVCLSVVAGGGLMYLDFNVWAYEGLAPRIVEKDELDFCGKLGLAIDVYATPSFSIGAEGNYTLGVEDLDDINYWNFSLGVAYHF